jgi:transcriptional regulator with XRE-family HTH domain
LNHPISNRIRQARAAKGITQVKLAEITEVSPTSAAAWESGTVPRDPMLEKIAAALDVTAAYLRDGDPEENILSILNQTKVKIAEALGISDSRIKLKVSFLG